MRTRMASLASVLSVLGRTRSPAAPAVPRVICPCGPTGGPHGRQSAVVWDLREHQMGGEPAGMPDRVGCRDHLGSGVQRTAGVEIPIVLGEGAGAYFEPYPVPRGEHVGSAPQVNPEFGDLARSQPGLRLPVAVSETG